MTAGLCFGVLLLSYLNWLLQLALLVALGTVVGSAQPRRRHAGALGGGRF